MTSPSWRLVFREAGRRLAATGIETARLDARLLMAATLGMAPERVPLEDDRPMTAAETERFAELLERRLAREPVSRILGRREFWSMDLALGPETLDPRPDSETLIQAVLDRLPGDRGQSWRILDLGTGSGCLLLALLSECPQAWGVGVDLSGDALIVARRNAVALGLSGRCGFVAGSWGDALCCGDALSWGDAPARPFDIIVSNPPYIPTREIQRLDPDVRQYDPLAALDGGADGLDAYRSLIPELARLAGGLGLVALEHGESQASEIITLLNRNGFRDCTTVADLAGRPRCTLAVRPAPGQAGGPPNSILASSHP